MVEATYNIPGSDCSICIKEGSILEQNGLKIVHCPRTFDTSSDIVPPRSVFGQFLRRCSDNGISVDVQIDSWCSFYASRAVDDDGRSHRRLVFEVGELCPIHIADEQFCIAAFSDTTSIYSAEIMQFEDYLSYWENLWSNLAVISVDRDVVNVAVPGDRLVSVATKGFPIQQKVGVIVNTFLQHIHTSGVCKHLNICLVDKAAADFDYEGWEKYILPYLEQQSHLPLVWKVNRNVSRPRLINLVTPTAEYKDTENVRQLFVDDLRQMINNIAKHLGDEYVQYEGSRKVSIIVDSNINGLNAFVEWFVGNETLMNFFVKRHGTKYDKNRMFQLMGALHDSTTLFGKLNRRSVIKLSLDEDGDFENRWVYLGDNIDNIINYVGQKLADLKKNNKSIYDSIWRSMPVEARKLENIGHF